MASKTATATETVIMPMSLRDFFAGQVITGIMLDPRKIELYDGWWGLAAEAYAIADAMLIERDLSHDDSTAEASGEPCNDRRCKRPLTIRKGIMYCPQHGIQ